MASATAGMVLRGIVHRRSVGVSASLRFAKESLVAFSEGTSEDSPGVIDQKAPCGIHSDVVNLVVLTLAYWTQVQA